MCIERNIVIVVAVILIMMFAFKVYSDNNNSEGFDQDIVPKPVMVMPSKMEMDSEGEKRNPNIDVTVGSIMDGPGYERSGNKVDGVEQEIFSRIPADYYFLDDGANGKYSVTSNLFSKSCCSTQWPTPFHQKYDPYVCNNKDEYVGSNYMGNNTFQDAGCMCLNQAQAKFLYNRGGNGREFF